MNHPDCPKKVTVPQLRKCKKKGQKIVITTAYDATMARIVDSTHIDIILVGDSLGMVIQGHHNTIPVTVDHIIYHTAAVARVTRRAHICADMPFMTNKVSPFKTLEYAARILQEGGAESVKIEGGVAIADTIEKLVTAGIPVIGHVGMTPQSVHAFGGFKRQGRGDASRTRIKEDAHALAEAGAFMVVLESIPQELAQSITDALPIPTIGIGAGPYCDGQVLVSTDLLGMDSHLAPPFVKQYARLGETARSAFLTYEEDVRTGRFPEANASNAPSK